MHEQITNALKKQGFNAVCTGQHVQVSLSRTIAVHEVQIALAQAGLPEHQCKQLFNGTVMIIVENK